MDQATTTLDDTTRSGERAPGLLGIAALASIGAGAVHAAAVGVHAEHETLSRLFVAVAVAQLGAGLVAVVRPGRPAAWALAAVNAAALAGWLERHPRVRRVHFRHQPVSPPDTYRRYFGCEVRFGQHADGVIFFQQDLDCPILGPDLQALAEVTAYIDRQFTRHRPPLHADVRGVIMLWLGTGDCTNERVAHELNLHTRTLHRHLRNEGTSFQQIKDEVRRDLMLYYLVETDADFAWISERLGFAEQSVMTRRCNLWFAMSPTKVRAQARS